jgi:hypothetical protein
MSKSRPTQLARRIAYEAGDGERFVATFTGTSDPLSDVLTVLEDAGADLLHVTAIHDPAWPPRFTPIEREILVANASDRRRAEYDPEFHAWAVANELEGANRAARV